MQLACAGLLLIRDRKLLLAYSKNKRCYYLPGGKINTGETPGAALRREIEEELNIHLMEEDLVYYGHISAPAYGEENGVVMEQECFLINKQVSPIASAEIGDLRYFTLEEYLMEKNIAPGATQVLQQLKSENLID